MASHQAGCLKVSHEVMAPILSYKVRAPIWDQFALPWGLFGVTCLCFIPFCRPLVPVLTADGMKSMSEGTSAVVALVSLRQHRSHSRRKGRRCCPVLPERILALVPPPPTPREDKKWGNWSGRGILPWASRSTFHGRRQEQRRGSTFTHLNDVVLQPHSDSHQRANDEDHISHVTRLFLHLCISFASLKSTTNTVVGIKPHNCISSFIGS